MDPARREWLARQSVHRQQIRLTRATRFRLELPVALEVIRHDPEVVGLFLHDSIMETALERGASPEVAESMRVVFVGGLDAAKAADQAWFTDYLSPGLILICYEAKLA